MVRRAIWLVLTGLVFCLVVLPALLVRGCAPAPPSGTGPAVSVYAVRSRRLFRMDLETYLTGVVAAEMPARFSLEALKAQAVAARTLAVKRLRRFGGRGCRHLKRADICDQPGDGQAWLSDADLRRAWGWRYAKFKARITHAVAETRGLVLLYDHRPIDAVYHSTCGGRTEDAVWVWSHRVPYLIGVPCGFDEFSPKYATRMRLGVGELARRLGLLLPEAVRAGKTPLDLQVLSRTPGGRVIRVQAAGKVFTGAAFRAALGLRSAHFTPQVKGTEVIFTVRGYGHGVGLCQYGAEGMARRGADYRQILRHYYTGVGFGRLREGAAQR